MTKIQHLSKTNQKAIWNRLISLGKRSSLQNPTEVEKLIYSLNVKNNYKNKLLSAYQYYCKANDISYIKPRKLHEDPFVVHVPTEERIDKIIACCGWVYSTVFTLSKYGLRPDEIGKLTFRNVDLENRKITVPTSKMGNQRTLQVKRQTVDILKEYLSKKKIQSPNDKLFGSTARIKTEWMKYRYRAFMKFKDPELLKIRLYDLRHWFGTTTYLNTRDIFFVKYALGHRRIDNTIIYIHLAESLTDYSDEFTSAVAKTIDEARNLIESGFEYVTEMDGTKLFRKRK